MTRHGILHALCLHLHQPPGNLRLLAETPDADGRRILLSYQRLLNHARKYAGVARIHLAVSCPLLEQLCDPAIAELWAPVLDLPALVEGLRDTAGIEFIGSGYGHSALPLIPADDWSDQLARERTMMERLLGRAPRGFHPAGGAFTAALVPALVRAGYRYILLPAGGLRREADGSPGDPFVPGLLRHGDAEIAVVPYDESLSAAQMNGVDVAWFADEVRARAGAADAVPRLLATWSDGENGEWFRSEIEGTGFFGSFYSPYMEFCEIGAYPVWPVLLSDVLELTPPALDLAWNGEAGQPGAVARVVLDRLAAASRRWWDLSRNPILPENEKALAEARELILDAEACDFLAAGDEVLVALQSRLETAETLLQAAELMAAPPPEAPSMAVPAVAEPEPQPEPEPAVQAVPLPEASVPEAPPPESPPPDSPPPDSPPVVTKPAKARTAAKTPGRPKKRK